LALGQSIRGYMCDASPCKRSWKQPKIVCHSLGVEDQGVQVGIDSRDAPLHPSNEHRLALPGSLLGPTLQHCYCAVYQQFHFHTLVGRTDALLSLMDCQSHVRIVAVHDYTKPRTKWATLQRIKLRKGWRGGWLPPQNALVFVSFTLWRGTAF
jgi:hypothetical protein